MMDNEFGNGALPSNSHKTRSQPTEDRPQRETKKVEKIVTGEAIRRKPPLGRRFKQLFIGGDSQGVLNYVMLDILLPGAKDVIADMVSQGIERTLFGEARSTSRRTGARPGRTNYNRFSQPAGNPYRSDPHGPDSSPTMSRRARATHDFDEIVLPTRHEADEVIDMLFELIQKFEVASVSDLYEMVGITPSFTDNKWGWMDLRGARAERVKNGYLVSLPRPEPID